MKRFFYCLLFSLLTVSLSAQELKVKELMATNDLSASQYRRNDINGQPCALIKVGLAAEDATFEGNVIQPVEYKSGEYWVYMTEGSLELRVKHPKFVPCHINFRDNGLERGVKSLTTYSMTLLLPQEQATQMQKLIVNYTPASALVIIDSKPYQGNGHLELELPVGNHDYQVVAVGYATVEGTVKLNAPRTITETLTAIGGEASSTAQSLQISTTSKRQLAPEDTARVKTFTVNGVSFNMIYVEGGTFTMGATPEQSSSALKDEKPAHQVTLSDYRIGETEVTIGLWYAVMGGKNAPKEEHLNQSYSGANWNDWQGFILKLNQLTGAIFRIPTEAEWEYAARGGRYSKGYKFSGSNELSDITPGKIVSLKLTNYDVKLRKPNELGLYDMSGNVEEWVYDWYGPYDITEKTNPTGPATGTHRVQRGGAVGYFKTAYRVSFRNKAKPDTNRNPAGLRLAL